MSCSIDRTLLCSVVNVQSRSGCLLDLRDQSEIYSAEKKALLLKSDVTTNELDAFIEEFVKFVCGFLMGGQGKMSSGRQRMVRMLLLVTVTLAMLFLKRPESHTLSSCNGSSMRPGRMYWLMRLSC